MTEFEDTDWLDGPSLAVGTALRYRRKHDVDHGAPVVVGGDDRLDHDGIPLGQCYPERPIDGEWVDIRQLVADTLKRTTADVVEDLRVHEAPVPLGVVVTYRTAEGRELVTRLVEVERADEEPGWRLPSRTGERSELDVGLGPLVTADD